jgi:hypothetical protein
MTQALYAHMNNKTIKKQNKTKQNKVVRLTLIGRPNWSQIIKQAGFKQALLRARSRARFTVPKEQGWRSHAGEMAAQFLYPG